MYLCHSDSPKSSVSVRLASLMRFSATAKYFGSFSIPIYCRFSMIAATQVVPLPIVLSKITPPFWYRCVSGIAATPRASASDVANCQYYVLLGSI